MLNPHKVLTLALVIGLILGGVRAIGSECQSCVRLKEHKTTHEQRLRQLKEILAKNKNALDRLDQGDYSKKTKINSNVLMAKIQIETVENNLTAINKGYERNQCTQCQ